MILWCDGAHDVVENMRRDRALLEGFDHAARAGVPRVAVLRLFAFDPPGITLGHAQDPARALDLERCRQDGVRWAIRPTGGRAIFHAEEWTYSLSAPLTDPRWGGSLATAYDRASRLIQGALARLGVPAVLARGTRPAPDAGAAAACFAATARHEILAAGRKLVGSAQRRTAAALLQQGSVLLGPGHRRLADYLAIPAARRQRIREQLHGAAAEAGGWLGDDRRLERWSEALAAELGQGIRPLQGAEGGFLLTLPESALYTSSASRGPGVDSMGDS